MRLAFVACLGVAAAAAMPRGPDPGDGFSFLGDRVTPAERARRAFREAHPYLDEALVVGEELIFSVRFGVIRAGRATMSIAGTRFVGRDSCYHIVTTAASNDLVSTFFHVRDRVESFVDTQTLLPTRYEKHLREGEYKADVVVEMDQRNNVAIYDDGQIFEMHPGSHDVLSAFYKVRAVELVPGQSFDLESHVDRKNYPIRVIVHGRERVEVPAGEFDCLVVEPVLRGEGLFKHQGRLMIWLTDDGRRIPVQVKSELPVGAISILLTEVRGREG